MFVKDRNIISKIRRSKVTDYAALTFTKKSPLARKCFNLRKQFGPDQDRHFQNVGPDLDPNRLIL